MVRDEYPERPARWRRYTAMHEQARTAARNGVRVAAAWLVFTACDPKPTPAMPTPLQAPKEQETPHAVDEPARPSSDGIVPFCLLPSGGAVPVICPGHSCGQSAEVYKSYLEALDTRGVQVQPTFPEAFRLIRESLVGAGGNCRNKPRLSLEVRNGEFVGVTGRPESSRVECGGAALVGARFRLEQLSLTHGRRIATITIEARGSVETFDGPKGELSTYRLVADSRPGIPAASLCRADRWLHPLEAETNHALVIQGEIYGRDASITQRGAHWFNIGCAGSALAKMRLHGMDPMKDKIDGATVEENSGRSTPDERQASLKMLTAKYCTAAGWTKDGTQIFWLGANGGSIVFSPVVGSAPYPERSIGPIEARWGAKGALCISHLRLWSSGSTCAKVSEQQWVKYVQARCGIPACDESLPCRAPSASTSDGAIWRTCTASHIPHQE
jgi:hypothetical protein